MERPFPINSVVGSAGFWQLAGTPAGLSVSRIIAERRADLHGNAVFLRDVKNLRQAVAS